MSLQPDSPLISHPGGVVVTVWVTPGSSRDAVGGIHRGALRVWVTAPPERGRATTAAGRLLKRAAGAPRVELLDGMTSRRKRFLVHGIDLAEAAVRFGLD